MPVSWRFSEGTPRYVEDPATKTADIRAAAFMAPLDEVAPAPGSPAWGSVPRQVIWPQRWLMMTVSGGLPWWRHGSMIQPWRKASMVARRRGGLDRCQRSGGRRRHRIAGRQRHQCGHGPGALLHRGRPWFDPGLRQQILGRKLEALAHLIAQASADPTSPSPFRFLRPPQDAVTTAADGIAKFLAV